MNFTMVRAKFTRSRRSCVRGKLHRCRPYERELELRVVAVCGRRIGVKSVLRLFLWLARGGGGSGGGEGGGPPARRPTDRPLSMTIP